LRPAAEREKPEYGHRVYQLITICPFPDRTPACITLVAAGSV
jgi:hypothetical protein